MECEVGVCAGRGIFSVRTGVYTFIAAEEAIVNLSSLLRGDLAFVLYRQVADAFIRVEPPIRLQSAGGAGIDASCAGGALALNRLVCLELERGNNLAEEYFRAEGGVYQHVVFAEESQAGAHGQCSLGQGYRIYANLKAYILVGGRCDEFGELAQSLLHEGMVVLVQGVASNSAV